MTVAHIDRKEEFANCVEKNIDSIYKKAYRLTKDENEAWDLVQQALCKAWRSFNLFEKGTNFKAWACMIVKNEHTNNYRRNQRKKDWVFNYVNKYLEPQHKNKDPDRMFEFRRIDDRVIDVIEDVDDKYSKVITKFALEQKSYKEIAEDMDIKIGTVMSRIYRARQRLKERIQEKFNEEEFNDLFRDPRDKGNKNYFSSNIRRNKLVNNNPSFIK